MPENTKKATFTTLEKKFWALTRPRQTAFLKALHGLSPQNKDLFSAWLGEESSLITANIIADIEKETVNRIKKFRKVRFAKINEILRYSEKYPLQILDKVDIYNAVWKGTLQFIVARSWNPERYEVAAARYLEKYLKKCNDIIETAEREDRVAQVLADLDTIVGIYPEIKLPTIMAIRKSLQK